MTYAQLVNLHLTMAQDHIELIENQTNQRKKQGLIVSCQYHLYLVTVFYLREIAVEMILPDVDSILSIDQFQVLLGKHQLVNGNINQLVNNKYWQQITMQHETTLMAQHSNHSILNTISSDQLDLSLIDTLKQAISELQSIIQLQRQLSIND